MKLTKNSEQFLPEIKMTSQIVRNMKTDTRPPRPSAYCRSFAPHFPPAFCQKVVFSIARLKERLHEKYQRAFPAHPALIRQAVADAEALAWETPFPHLVLPDFAELRLAQVIQAHQTGFVAAA